MSANLEHKRTPEHASMTTVTIAGQDLTRMTLSVDDLCFVVLEGPAAGRSLQLDRECLVIGRKDWCDLNLKDPTASSQHCEIWLTGKGVRVRDLDSHNGVFVGGCRVLDAFLSPGDTVKIGKSVMELRRANDTKREIEVPYRDQSGLLVGKSEEMRQLFSYLARFGQHDFNLLLTGETGTGKSYIAEALHKQSTRKHGPFVAVNCGAIPDDLIESQLFGHEKGAFTGAEARHIGFFEEANGGTLFLDEIGELPMELQRKLLTAVELKKIRRIGGAEIKIDVRIISATNRSLAQEIEASRFREDLYYRIAIMELEIPPLRNRREDIPLLADHFLAHKFAGQSIQLTPDAIKALQSFDWPGNIRQLNNILERSCYMLEGTTLHADALYFRPSQRPQTHKVTTMNTPTTPVPSQSQSHPKELPLLEHFQQQGLALDDYLEQVKYTLLKQAHEASGQVASQTSKLLGKSKSWTYDMLKRFGIRS